MKSASGSELADRQGVDDPRALPDAEDVDERERRDDRRQQRRARGAPTVTAGQ